MGFTGYGSRVRGGAALRPRGTRRALSFSSSAQVKEEARETEERRGQHEQARGASSEGSRELFGIAQRASPGEVEPGPQRAGLPPENEESQRTQTDDEEDEEKEEKEEEVEEEEEEEEEDKKEEKKEEREAEEAEGNLDRRSSHLGVTWVRRCRLTLSNPR
jgi:hypothetical protein